MGAFSWSGQLEPMPGKLIVRFEESEETFVPGGLIAKPDTYRRDKDECVVLAVGPAKYDANGNYIEPPVRVGDRIISSQVWGKGYRYYDDDGDVHGVVVIGFGDVIARIKG